MGLDEGAIGEGGEALGVGSCSLTGSAVEMSGGRAVQVMALQWEGEPVATCPECGETMRSHGSRILKVAAKPSQGIPTRLDITFPRRRCPACGYVWRPVIEGVDVDHRMTEAACAAIAQLSLRLSFRAVAEEYPVSHVTVKNVFEDYVRMHADGLRFKTPTFLGIDEKSFGRIGLVIVITDLETRTLFDMVEGRTQEALDGYFSKLPGLEKVRWVMGGMYCPFWKSIAKRAPNATLAIDRFHVVKGADDALDAVLRYMDSDAGETGRLHLKKSIAGAVRKRRHELDASEAGGIRELRKDKRYADLVKAYDLREGFFDIYDENPESRKAAEEAFERWAASIPDGSLFEPFRALARTAESRREHIFNWWDCPARLSDAYAECANRLIRETDMKGRGCSFETLRARTLYRGDDLERIMRSGGQSIGPRFDQGGELFATEAGGGRPPRGAQ